MVYLRRWGNLFVRKMACFCREETLLQTTNFHDVCKERVSYSKIALQTKTLTTYTLNIGDMR